MTDNEPWIFAWLFTTKRKSVLSYEGGIYAVGCGCLLAAILFVAITLILALLVKVTWTAALLWGSAPFALWFLWMFTEVLWAKFEWGKEK